jgi:hypothetical protein
MVEIRAKQKSEKTGHHVVANETKTPGLTNKAIREGRALENEAFLKQQINLDGKIEKLKNVTEDHGAFPAEVESAGKRLATVEALRDKPKPRGHFDPPPMPSKAEFLAGRKTPLSHGAQVKPAQYANFEADFQDQE